MGITYRAGMADLLCDVCREAHFVEETGSTYDEARLALTRAKEFGWQIGRRGRQLEAVCPDCASATNHAWGPEGLP